MASGQVARRYAQAWISAATETKSLDSLAADSSALLSMVRGSPDFQAFLNSPLVSKKDQAKVINTLADKAGLGPLTRSFLSTIVNERRLHALPDILAAALSLLDAASGTLKAQVTSATVLDEKKLSEIRAQLAKKTGGEVAIETRVDPSIIGGLVVRVGSKMIDDSVKTKLERMARRLQGKAA